MNVDLFIRRPVLAAGISIIIVLLGVISLLRLPVEKYPNMAPPTVVVSANYTGANAQTVQRSVIAPLEEAINGVENMTYITSTAAAGGRVTITVYFRPGTDADMAAVNVQNRVNAATSVLPAEVVQSGITTTKQENTLVAEFALYSDDDTKYDRVFLANWLKLNVEPALQRIPGVGNVNAMGQEYSMRLWLKPDKMAQYGLVPQDISDALAEQNIEAATGSLGEDSNNAFQYTLRYTGRLQTPEQFSNIVVKALPQGEVLRVKDVAKVELGSLSDRFTCLTDGKTSVYCQVFQQPGSNATEVVNQVKAYIQQVEKELPSELHIQQVDDANKFLSASIGNVVETLIEAILLVVLVVYVFLQNLRSTLIPTVSILVSLVGTFAFLALVDFSLNLLTLFAMVLVIGTVVDDSIVVVEAVQTKFDEGYTSPYLATHDGMKGITGAIFTCSLVFMIVFIPVAFSGGIAGKFYTQFGVTMAVAVGLSAVNALTLCPALCAIIMRPASEDKGLGGRVRKAYDVAFRSIMGKYRSWAFFFIRRRWISGALVVLSVVLFAFFMTATRTGLIPSEDLGIVRLNIMLPQGSSRAATDTTHSMAELPWKEVFTDPLLQKLIEQGLASNTDLKIAELRTQESVASLQAAKLAFLPGLSLEATGGAGKTGTDKVKGAYGALLSADWEVDLFGKISNAEQQERARLEQSEDYRQAVQTRLVATIATNYYTLVMLHRQLDLADSTKLNWQENVRVLQAMMRAGVANEAAVSQAEADLLAVEVSQHDIRGSITELENSLSALLGRTSGAIDVDWEEGHDFNMPALSTGVPADMLSNRPDVRRAEAVLREAFYATNSAKAAFYPSLRLSATGGWTTGAGAAITHPAQFLASAIGSLTQPLFSRGQLQRDLKIAQSRQEQARLQFVQSLLDAGAEVSNALSAYHSAVEKRNVISNRKQKQEQAVRATRLMMNYGTSTSYLEVLSAQRALFDVRMSSLSNAYNEAQSLIQLYRALGGGAQ